MLQEPNPWRETVEETRRASNPSTERQWIAAQAKKKRGVIDAEVSKDLDSIPHRELRAFLDLWIKDGVIRRRINPWLRAGVLEKDARHADGQDRARIRDRLSEPVLYGTGCPNAGTSGSGVPGELAEDRG